MSFSLSWIPALAGVAAAVIIALKISRQGGLHVERLWIMPTVTAAILAATARAVGADIIHSRIVWICAAIGVVIGHIQARYAIDRIDVASRIIVTRGGAAMVLIGLALAAGFQWLLKGASGFDAGPFAVACLAMGLASVATEKLTYFFAFLRARAAAKSIIGERA